MKFYNHQSVRSSVECFHCGQIEAEGLSGHQAFQVGLTRRGHWTGFPSLFLSYDDYQYSIRPHTSAVALYVPYILRARAALPPSSVGHPTQHAADVDAGARRPPLIVRRRAAVDVLVGFVRASFLRPRLGR